MSSLITEATNMSTFLTESTNLSTLPQKQAQSA